MDNSKNNNSNKIDKYKSNTDYYTDNSNDRPYVTANRDYSVLVNISYLKSGIYFNENAQKGLK